MKGCMYGGIVCSFNFLFLFIKTKEKNTVFEPFNLRIYFEKFTYYIKQFISI